MANSTRVSIDPGQVETLKEKYGINEAGLTEILENVQVHNPVASHASPAELPLPEQSTPRTPDFMTALSKGDVSLGEAILLIDFMDRKEERKKAQEQPKTSPMRPEDVGKWVAAGVAQALEACGIGSTSGTAPEQEQLPEWAKEISDNNKTILDRFKHEDDEKERQKMINEATGPLKSQLEQMQAKINEISSTPPPNGTAAPKSVIDQYVEGRNQLEKAGILKPERSNIMLGPDGNPIPISGEIPAALVYGPFLAKEVIQTLEASLDRIATKYGLMANDKKPAIQQESIINLPPKPISRPIPKPSPQEQKPTPPVSTELSSSSEAVIIMPEKPAAQKQVIPTEPTQPTEQITQVPEPSTETEDAAKRFYDNSADNAGDISAPTEKAKQKKAYICKHCGEGPFESRSKLANHSKKCPKAIEAREKKGSAQ